LAAGTGLNASKPIPMITVTNDEVGWILGIPARQAHALKAAI
jgi:hypothetical protein